MTALASKAAMGRIKAKVSLTSAPIRAGCLFTDIEDSTRRWEKNPAAMREALSRHDTIIENVVAAHGGAIRDRAGDGVFALFANDNALCCALEIQIALAREDWTAVEGLPVRIGVHLGQLDDAGEPDRVAANRASRITECGWGGQILASDEARRHFRAPPGVEFVDFGHQQLRGVAAPIRVYGLVHPELTFRSFPPLRASPDPVLGLPAAYGPLIGREQDVRDVESALTAGERLVTIVAPGGTGKTRLLAELAQRISRTRPTCFVSLRQGPNAPIALEAARALNLQLSGDHDERSQVIEYLRNRDFLLALDGVESASDADAFAAAVLASCTQVSIIAASRVPLGAQGERLVRLGGLSCASGEVERVRTSPAYRMFAAEALRFDPAFALGHADAAAFYRISTMLGGSPLALKLAARWRGILSLSEIEARLSEGPDFLASSQAGDAQESAPRSVFEGAWRLLDPAQQRCLARLSVFRGGFDLEGAEYVTQSPAAVLLELEDRGLIQRTSAGRFDVHALILSYARERLEENDKEALDARLRHAGYFLSLLKPPLGPEQIHTLDKVELNLTNLETAWAYALDEGLSELTQERAEALFYLLVYRSRFHEGQRFFNGHPPGELGAYFAAVRANCLIHIGRLSEAHVLASAAAGRARETRARAHAIHALGNIAHSEGRHEDAHAHYQEALALRADDPLGRAYTCLSIGWLELIQARPAKARQRVRECYEICRESGDTAGIMRTYMLAGDIALTEQRLEDARANFTAALELEELVREPANRSVLLRRLARIFIELEDYEAAIERASQAIEITERIGEARAGAFAQIERARARRGTGDIQGARTDLVSAFRRALSLQAVAVLTNALEELASVETQAGNHDYAGRLMAALESCNTQVGPLRPQGEGRDVATEAIMEDLLREAEFTRARL